MANKKSILTNNQKVFLAEFKKQETLASTFYLTGGTALAEFYLHHRLSEDLDFFCDHEFDHELVFNFINQVQKTLNPQEVMARKRNGREIFELTFNGDEILKVEFVHYPYHNLKPFKTIHNLSVNHEFDIAVNKIFAVFSRNEVKDYVDLYYLFKKYPILVLLNGVAKKFDITLDQFTLGNELYKARYITQLPHMIKKLSKEQLIDFFKDEARRLGAVIF